MLNEVPWFSRLIGALSSDYLSYNQVLKLLIEVSARPLKARLDDILREERRLSLKIIRQEEIIRGWLEEAPVLSEKAALPLSALAALRKESAGLRIRGSESLKSGLALLEKERSRIRIPDTIKSTKKEAAPRLIDIQL